MVLIHGIGSNKEIWEPVIPALSARFDTIAVDLPGFGESPLPASGSATIEEQADAVEAMLDSMEIDRAHFVGNSMGGRLALELAVRGRALDVVALAPHGAFTPGEGRKERFLIRIQRGLSRAMKRLGALPFRTRLGRRALLGVTFGRPEQVPPEVAAHAVESFADASGFESAFESICSAQPTGLGGISCPVLIVWGDKDRLLSPRQGPRMAGMVKGAELRELPGIGHVPMWDDPALTASVVIAFVGSEPRRA